jgi:hypothetical protein
MRKPVLSTVAISLLCFSGLVGLFPQVTNAKQTNQSPLSWLNISQVLFKKKPPINPRKGGSRPYIAVPCMISPDAPNNIRIVWSDRPTFIWQGNAQTVAVKSVKSEQILWSETVDKIQHITYTGEALQPGQTYQWKVISGGIVLKFVNFKIMGSQQRDRITVELQALEKQLQAEGADSEAITLAKANYFAQNQLWSDFLQQMYSVNTFTPELESLRTQISQKLCEP